MCSSACSSVNPVAGGGEAVAPSSLGAGNALNRYSCSSAPTILTDGTTVEWPHAFPEGPVPEEIPLFPLNTVLFPGMPLPLHIFEPRYREMIGACVRDERPFGVVLIKEGREVGEAAMPFEVGTLAKIVGVERLDDGRMNVVTVGTDRFR